jgi:hypothetical protein
MSADGSIWIGDGTRTLISGSADCKGRSRPG